MTGAQRSYYAWLRAARKASKKTGGLSYPAARKAYKVAAARIGRPLKGVDVKNHPRITRDAIKVAVAPGKPKRGATSVRKPSVARRAAPVKPPVAKRAVARKIRSVEAYLAGLADMTGQFFEEEEIEYVSTAEYRKK